MPLFIKYHAEKNYLNNNLGEEMKKMSIFQHELYKWSLSPAHCE